MAIEWDVPVDLQQRWIELPNVEAGRCPNVLTEPWYRWLGSFWLWADGHLLGNPVEIEQLGVGLMLLRDIGDRTGQRSSELLMTKSPQEALDLVMESIYGQDADSVVADNGDLQRFELMPLGCPFFDGWQAILLEHADAETIIWRHGSCGPVETATWPVGEIRRIVNSTFDQLSVE